MNLCILKPSTTNERFIMQFLISRVSGKEPPCEKASIDIECLPRWVIQVNSLDDLLQISIETGQELIVSGEEDMITIYDGRIE